MAKLRSLALQGYSPDSPPEYCGDATGFPPRTNCSSLFGKLSGSPAAMSLPVEEFSGPDSMGSSRPSGPKSGDVADLVRRIVEKVNNYNPDKIKGWDALRSTTKDARLFRIESNPRVFLFNKNGAFDGRAEVLVHVPQTLPSGRKFLGSMALPARVLGHIDPNDEITIDEIALNE